MYIPNNEDLEEYQDEEYINVDLGYIIGGLILYIEEVEE